MDWGSNSDENKRPILTSREQVLYGIGIMLTILIVLTFFSPMFMPWLYESDEYEASLLLRSDDDSWFYGTITLVYSDSPESVNFIMNGPLIETFSNGTIKRYDYKVFSVNRYFQTSIGVTLTYNCTGQNNTIGPIQFDTDSSGLVYSDSQGQEIHWQL
ncbi:MAG: hypothetical protein ACW98Y_06855 [Candidatus Thorarchaeota archaeon]|jgi:hypothetical protein